jgi:integrase
VVFTALRRAVKWQLAARNVAEAVDAPKARRKKIDALEPADAVRILNDVSGMDLEMSVVLALGTGMRRGELLGLRWRDIDLGAGVARISQTVQTDGSFSTPKTHRSDRPVSLPPFVVDALRKQRKEQNERRLVCGDAWQDLDLVVDRGDGLPMPPMLFICRSDSERRPRPSASSSTSTACATASPRWPWPPAPTSRSRRA